MRERFGHQVDAISLGRSFRSDESQVFSVRLHTDGEKSKALDGIESAEVPIQIAAGDNNSAVVQIQVVPYRRFIPSSLALTSGVNSGIQKWATASIVVSSVEDNSPAALAHYLMTAGHFVSGTSAERDVYISAAFGQSSNIVGTDKYSGEIKKGVDCRLISVDASAAQSHGLLRLPGEDGWSQRSVATLVKDADDRSAAIGLRLNRRNGIPFLSRKVRVIGYSDSYPLAGLGNVKDVILVKSSEADFFEQTTSGSAIMFERDIAAMVVGVDAKDSSVGLAQSVSSIFDGWMNEDLANQGVKRSFYVEKVLYGAIISTLA